jgi:hypothetical protein
MAGFHDKLGFYHRDLKPNNVGFVLDHVQRSLKPKIFDFSRAKGGAKGQAFEPFHPL